MTILIVDENPLDAQFAATELRRSGIVAECITAEDEASLRRTLAARDIDVVLYDLSFPHADGIEPAAVVREYHPLVPLIFVSGTISEERAVLALQSGGVDYVLKSNLIRLPSAVRRAVAEAREHKRLRGFVTVAELRGSRQSKRFEALWHIANDASLSGDEMFVAMLTEAAAALREPQRFGGVLTKLEGDDIVVLLTTPEDEDGRGRVPGVGARMPLGGTLAARTERTRAWESLSAAGEAPTVAVRLGWRSVLTTKFSVGDETYFLTFGSIEPVTRPFGSETLAYVELVAGAVAGRMRVTQLESSLRASEARSRFQAERLERLWHIANDPDVAVEELWMAMLRECAASIQPGVVFDAFFGRIAGDAIVSEAIVGESNRDATDLPFEVEEIAVPLAGSIVAKLLAAGGGTRAFNDLRGSGFETAHSRHRGWRALIVTTFVAGDDTFALICGHAEPAAAAFDVLDDVYMKMLGAFFARHVRRR